VILGGDRCANIEMPLLPLTASSIDSTIKTSIIEAPALFAITIENN